MPAQKGSIAYNLLEAEVIKNTLSNNVLTVITGPIALFVSMMEPHKLAGIGKEVMDDFRAGCF